MNHEQRSAAPAVAAYATAPVGGLSSGDRTDRSGGEQGDGARTAPATGPVASVPSDGGASWGPSTPWAAWAEPQVAAAVDLAATLAPHEHAATLAARLHRDWYSAPLAGHPDPLRGWGPLGGLYRRAHAGSGAPVRVHGLSVVDRHDTLGRDGWWRTWGERWLPTRSRAGSVRVLLTPRPDRLPEFVTVLTAGLRPLELPWLLACPTDVRRLHRAGAAQLLVPAASSPDPALLDRLAPMLVAATPPLCRPLRAGVAVAEDSGAGLTFGMYRCRLLAAGLLAPDAHHDPLGAVARAFTAGGLDPAEPHRTPR